MMFVPNTLPTQWMYFAIYQNHLAWIWYNLVLHEITVHFKSQFNSDLKHINIEFTCDSKQVNKVQSLRHLIFVIVFKNTK